MIRYLLLSLVLLAGCAPKAPADLRQTPTNENVFPAESWSDQALAALTLRQKVGQMIFPRVEGDYLSIQSDAHTRLSEWVAEHGVGGVLIASAGPLEMASKLNLLQQMADLPLLVTADMEHGPGQRVTGGTQFPPVMAIGATGDERLAYEMGRITAVEARAVGVHMTYAPVVDVNNNAANPIINTRSYGERPEDVAKMAAAYIRGVQEHGLLATAKHFPGHGDTGTDSHIDLPIIHVDRARADSVELFPFRAAFSADVAGVMSAHIAFPALTGDSTPATLSPQLLSGLLREELGFGGLAITDALNMGGIVRSYGEAEAAVLAVKAGADVLLMPPNIPLVIEAIVSAIESGEISEDRINESVQKLLHAKARLGLHRHRTVELNQIPHLVGSRSHRLVAEEAAERSITLVRDRDELIPSSTDLTILSIVYTDDRDPTAGRTLQRAVEDRSPGATTVLVADDARSSQLDTILKMAEHADLVFFSPFIRVRAWKGDVAVARPVAELVEELARRQPTVVTSFGNPYVLEQFPGVSTYLVAWGQGELAQNAAARAWYGETPINGSLPVSLPPYHPVGAGLLRETSGSEHDSQR